MRYALGMLAVVVLAGSCSSSSGSNHVSSRTNGQAPKPSKPSKAPKPSKPTIVRGVAVEKWTGKPLAGVTILLLSQTRDSADPNATDCKRPDDLRCVRITDDSGRFEFRVDAPGERSLKLVYTDITVVWRGSLCKGRATALKIEIDTSTAGGSFTRIAGKKSSCRDGRSTISCPEKPLIDPTGIPGRARLSTAAHQRPSLAQVSAQLPTLLATYRAATYQAVRRKTLAPFTGSVSSCTRMADLLTFFFRRGYLSPSSSHGEIFVPPMGVVLAGVLVSLKPVAIRFNKTERWAVDVFLSEDKNAKSVPADRVKSLDRKKQMALLITRQDGKLVLAGISRPLLEYVKRLWTRALL